MQILLINNSYPTDRYPERSTYIQTMKECLQRVGHDVDVLALLPSGLSMRVKICDYLRFYVRLCFYQIGKYDLLYVNHYVYLFPLFLRVPFYGGKVLFHWHGSELVSNVWYLKLLRRICRITFRDRYRHVSPSRYYKKIIMNRLHVKEQNILVSPSGGVDTDLFRPCSENGCASDEIVIGFSSALTSGKGGDFVVQLMREKEDMEKVTGKHISFKIINYGREADYYIQKMKSITQDIEFVDRMPKKKMPEFYNSLSLLLLPSIRTGESLGLVVLEAMSCNRPVVTWDLFAFPEFVLPNQSGELAHYTQNAEERIGSIKKSIVKVIDNYRDYHPRDIVYERYSSKSVVDFYKTL